MCCNALALSISYFLTEFATKFNVISSTKMSYLVFYHVLKRKASEKSRPLRFLCSFGIAGQIRD